jgi:hypothetical protein
MDQDLILIFSFVTVALMIIGLSVNGIVGKIVRYKKDVRKMELAQSNKASAGEINDRNDMIEARLQVLERIATDRKDDLSAQIEQLRDLDRLEDRTQ